MRHDTEIAIVGRACRLPGAASVAGLWRLLSEGRCAVTRVPTDRWNQDRFGHPRQGERGKSYTWAAGVLDDIWGFDAAAFGLSPREAEQMDPQQRLLLELVWEALEDAGIRPASLAGTETGVFVGASTTDHGTSKIFDVSATDGYFATGNAASILSNRISYIYDLNGPSFTVDTACSSSLVALDAAMQALRSGRVDTAIVGGVSVFANPFAFINFSQASMLSRIGLCQPFSARADGYVRAEGGGVLVLRPVDAARADGNRLGARIVASRINSDGRTNGIALPSAKRQAKLLEQLYEREGLDPGRLAFVEAHGTGTPVGDPIEAKALGEVLGQRRAAPLPVGSIKSNIGHTEAAAGIAGVLKASLALEHDLLPASLHCVELNPHIDFDRLNLTVATTARTLPREAGRLAGVSSYGFGGTNSHVVIADAPADDPRPAGRPAAVMMLSAHSRAALGALAAAYADRLDAAPGEAATVAAATNHRRDRREERLVVRMDEPATAPQRLRAFAEAGAEGVEGLTIGTAVGGTPRIAFVYSGNGGQWVGMGRTAYRGSVAFRSRFDEVDRLFEALSGWSLVAMMHSETLAEQLVKTSVAQPLIFAIQSATTFALRELGLGPDLVLGHSVGEVAAAEAAGILDRKTAVKVIYYRSLHQETVAGAGGMTVLIGSRETARSIEQAVPGATIAAYNSTRAFTFSGSLPAIEAVAEAARGLKARTQKLDIAYPFHSPLIAAIREPLLDSLGALPGHPATIPFVSTVTGRRNDGEPLGADYWWRNIREPVLFAAAVEAASREGARLFVEIGPSAILLSHVNDILSSGEAPVATLPVLDRKDPPGDAFERAVAAAMARGADLGAATLIGDDPGGRVALPAYPWQRRPFHLAETSETVQVLTPKPWHPLIGARYAPDALEWHAQIDTALLPDLADHVVDGHILLPGAAFIEMALAVARDWLGTATAALAGFEIHQPMILVNTGARDIRCRVQPTTGTVEIMSRPRLSPAAWQTHAVAKVLRQAIPADAVPPPDADAPTEMVTGDAIYPLAAESGLAYGPAFRLLGTARRFGPGRIVVDLLPGGQDARYGIDPARVDACFHGLALLYRELSVNGRLKPYVPVGAGEVRLFAPGAAVTRALIEVERSDERTIIVDFTLLDGDDAPVALLRRMRFQAMSAFRASTQAVEHVVATAVLAAEPLAVPGAPTISPADIAAAARAIDGLGEGEAPSSAFVLMDGWATATAYGLLESLSDDGLIDVDALVGQGRLPATLEPWYRRLLIATERSGLVTRLDDGLLSLRSGVDLPDPQDILRALAADHPERSAELLLAARTGAIVDAIVAGGFEAAAPVSLTALDGFELGAPAATGSAALLAAILDQAGAAWPTDRTMRVLVVGGGPLMPHAVRIAAERGAAICLVETDRRRLERAKLGFERYSALTFEGSVAGLPPQAFDLVLAVQSAQRVLADALTRSQLEAAMAPGATLAVIEPSASVFRDVVFGLQAAMAGQPDEAMALASEAGWAQALRGMGLDEIAVHPTRGTDFALLCMGRKLAVRGQRPVKAEALILGRGGALEATAEALATMLRFSGSRASSLIGRDRALELATEVPDTIVHLGEPRGEASPADRLSERCLDIKALAAAIGARKTTLWIVCPGATRAGGDGLATAVEAGVWAFCRTLANETPTLDIKLVDLVPGLSAEVAARRLRDVILSDTDESEIVVDAAETRVLRFDRLTLPHDDAIAEADLALRLVKGDHATGLDRLQWARETRPAPAAGEVEIAVEAAGLNFRDVMWGLSILPEEILEDGFAGATLGLECAGRVVRTGAEVTTLAVGDRVLAFAKAALATHVTVPTSVVATLPQGLDATAAATIPVAFLTAFYGLIRCARLQEDEWVLIHGGAGGVGLAAIQIARWCGARVIATAGAPERRDLLTTLGAEHVFDSRSNQFVDDVRRVTGSGVDVVLNSLSGEAMERSISVLRPFGRFVELGKRDYVANTHIGLKPFRRNLSYFGVDLDQLMLKDDTAGRDLFAEVMGLFTEGALTPLPYRTFAAAETVEAFRVMQRSGHIGKIVITPPTRSTGAAAASPAPLRISAEGAHLVTGGLGGFGLETARWLVDHGARHLVLVGRTGAASAGAQAGVATLESLGATVTTAALDITDAAAMAALFARFGADLPPLAGVVHAAIVFDDALVATMTEARLRTVLAAKVAGAAILDRLTAAHNLDYFLLYSSATTVIGNPGQGAYVAANGFLEGLARSRRARGLPGFAVAWGAIEDVGVLTRSSTAATNLLQRSGVLGMAARRALDDLFATMPRVGPSPEAAVLTLAAVNWSAAREHLPVLRSRSFERLMHGTQAAEAGGKTKINVRALVDEIGAPAAARQLSETIIEEIARILRLPREDVSRNKPLMEIGLDSLMAVELGMGLEERFELDAPMSTSAGAMTVIELADYVVGAAAGEAGAADEQTTGDLALRHLDPTVRKDVLDALPARGLDALAASRKDGTKP